MRVLGVDFGGKRIGIAVGDSSHGITTALPNLPACGALAKDAKNIAEVAKKELAEAIVVGVPKNPEEGSQRMERICLQLAVRLKQEGWNVYTVDEAFTSRESELNLESSYGRKEIQKRIDGEAARIILESFFNG